MTSNPPLLIHPGHPEPLPTPIGSLAADLDRSPGRVLVKFLASFFILLILFTLLFWLTAPEVTPSIELTHFGSFLVDNNFNSYLLHAGLAFALLLILIGIYLLTSVKYVLSWAGAMGWFLCFYLYLLIRPLFFRIPPDATTIGLPSWDGYVTEMLSAGSTILILVSAMQLLRIDLPVRRLLGSIGVLLFLLLTLHSLFRELPISGSAALLPGSVLSLLTLWTAGYAVSVQMGIQPRQRRTALLFFGAYGLAQPLILVLTVSHDVSVAANAVLYVLKALCTFSLILLVLNETWREKEVQRKAAERGLLTQERLLNTTNTGMFRTDRTGLIVEVNSAEARILGVDSGHIVGTVNRFDLIANPGERTRVVDELTSGRRVEGFRHSIRTPRGGLRYLLTSCASIDTADFAGFEGIDHDVTAEVLHDQEVRREQHLRDGFHEAIAGSDLRGYSRRILEVVVANSNAEEGLLLLVGQDTERSAPLLIVEAASGRFKNFLGRVIEMTGAKALADLAGENRAAVRILSQQLLGQRVAKTNLAIVRMEKLEQRLLGLVCLRSSTDQEALPKEQMEVLRRFLGRVAINYPLVSRNELQRLRTGVRIRLHRPTNVEDQMVDVARWLCTALAVEEIRVALRLRQEADPIVFSSSGNVGGSLNSVIGSLGKDFSQELRQRWWAGPPGRSEVAVPILDQLRQPLGSLLLRNPVYPYTARVSALSEVHLAKLTEVAEAIGVVAEMWISVRSRSRLLETATHEFRSPAVAIRNTADRLAKNWSAFSEGQIDRKLADILADASLLINLSNNLDDSGKLVGPRARRRVLVFKEIVFKIFRQLSPLAPKLKFEHEGTHRLPALVVVEEELSQIVFNLISNAIKYSDKEGEVRVRVVAGEGGDFFTLRVQDWGIGIPEGFEDKIFEREVRAPNALAREVRGMGMGLAVSRELVERLDGKLLVSRMSDPTELTLFLPKTAAYEDDKGVNG